MRLEVVDGDNGNAYAWIAVGRFSLPGLNASDVGDLLQALHPLLRRRISPEIVTQSEKLLNSEALSPRLRAALVSAFADATQQPLAQALCEQALEMNQPALIASDLVAGAPAQRGEASTKTAQQLSASATARQQVALATRLMRTAVGCGTLVQLIDQGK